MKLTIEIDEAVYLQLYAEATANGEEVVQYVSNKVSEKYQKKVPECYQQFIDAYFVFFQQETNGIKPAFQVADFVAVKKLIKFLDKQDGGAMNNWLSILSNWHKLHPALKSQIDIRSINQNINKIIYALTHKARSKRSFANFKGI